MKRKKSSILCGDCWKLLRSHHIDGFFRGVTPEFCGMRECCKRWKIVMLYYHTRKEGKN